MRIVVWSKEDEMREKSSFFGGRRHVKRDGDSPNSYPNPKPRKKEEEGFDLEEWFR